MVGGVPWQIKGSGGRRLTASASSQPYLMFLIVGPLHENCCFDLNQKRSFFFYPAMCEEQWHAVHFVLLLAALFHKFGQQTAAELFFRHWGIII